MISTIVIQTNDTTMFHVECGGKISHTLEEIREGSGGRSLQSRFTCVCGFKVKTINTEKVERRDTEE